MQSTDEGDVFINTIPPPTRFGTRVYFNKYSDFVHAATTYVKLVYRFLTKQSGPLDDLFFPETAMVIFDWDPSQANVSISALQQVIEARMLENGVPSRAVGDIPIAPFQLNGALCVTVSHGIARERSAFYPPPIPMPSVPDLFPRSWRRLFSRVPPTANLPNEGWPAEVRHFFDALPSLVRAVRPAIADTLMDLPGTTIALRDLAPKPNVGLDAVRTLDTDPYYVAFWTFNPPKDDVEALFPMPPESNANGSAVFVPPTFKRFRFAEFPAEGHDALGAGQGGDLRRRAWRAATPERFVDVERPSVGARVAVFWGTPDKMLSLIHPSTPSIQTSAGGGGQCAASDGLCLLKVLLCTCTEFRNEEALLAVLPRPDKAEPPAATPCHLVLSQCAFRGAGKLSDRVFRAIDAVPWYALVHVESWIPGNALCSATFLAQYMQYRARTRGAGPAIDQLRLSLNGSTAMYNYLCTWISAESPVRLFRSVGQIVVVDMPPVKPGREKFAQERTLSGILRNISDRVCTDITFLC